jgi:kynureninase
MLTSYLEYLLDQLIACKLNILLNFQSSFYHISIEKGKNETFEQITPKNPDERGSQLSIKLNVNGKRVYDELCKKGIVVSS